MTDGYWLALILTGLKVLDGISTYIGITHYGLREANPFGRMMFKRIGMVPALVLDVPFVGLLSVLYAHQFPHTAVYVLSIGVMMFLFVVTDNFRRNFQKRDNLIKHSP